VLQFCDYDLARLLSVNAKLTLGEIKKVMQQLLNGLYYLHSNKVCRDSKARISEFCSSDVSESEYK
jgi:serine/threonine protein kinase